MKDGIRKSVNDPFPATHRNNPYADRAQAARNFVVPHMGCGAGNPLQVSTGPGNQFSVILIQGTFDSGYVCLFESGHSIQQMMRSV
jgi:hypothetical protein